MNFLGWLKNKLLTGSSAVERESREDQVLYNTHPRCESGFGVEQLIKIPVTMGKSECLFEVKKLVKLNQCVLCRFENFEITLILNLNFMATHRRRNTF